MFDWDDLRIFVAAARAGSFAEGGRSLGLDTATVSRRVARLERNLRATLIIRTARGLHLTAVGAQIFERGIVSEGHMEQVTQATDPHQISGVVRISASEGFGVSILAPAVSDLARKYPELRIELAASSGFLSPASREVDMAITLSPLKGGRLIVEPLTKYQLGLYASQQFIRQHGAPSFVDDLKNFPLVGYVEDLIYAPELRYMDEVAPDRTSTLSSSSILAQRAMILGGGGIGILPCFLADGLARLLPDKISLERRFWVSTHRELYALSRMRIVRTWLQQLVRRRRTSLLPGRPR